jgi:DNA-directed RNA polymerase specialized sigma24 family protein
MSAQSHAIPTGFEQVRLRAVSRANREVAPEAFDRLLEWLHPDKEKAGPTYEQIRRKLIKVFTSRCCDCPEELADETIDRVAAKVDQVAGGYQGDPALYFYGVARNVCREYRKVKKLPERLPLPPEPEPIRPELDCLEECMEHLLPKNRELILDYYQGDRRSKIAHRKELASRYHLDMNALRIRIYRIRSVLSECTASCLQNRGDSTRLSDLPQPGHEKSHERVGRP